MGPKRGFLLAVAAPLVLSIALLVPAGCAPQRAQATRGPAYTPVSATTSTTVPVAAVTVTVAGTPTEEAAATTPVPSQATTVAAAPAPTAAGVSATENR